MPFETYNDVDRSFYESIKVSSTYFMGKKSGKGKMLYHQQMYAACFVKTGSKVVIPVFYEMIAQNDGSLKNDSERNASRRFFNEFGREHPHTKVIVVEDALSSNGPHIKELKKHDLRFILGAKPNDHTALFKELDRATDEGRTTEVTMVDPEYQKKGYHFKYLNNLALNQSHPDLMVNSLKCIQLDKKQNVQYPEKPGIQPLAQLWIRQKEPQRHLHHHDAAVFPG